jgi:hypothetical protein
MAQRAMVVAQTMRAEACSTRAVSAALREI